MMSVDYNKIPYYEPKVEKLRAIKHSNPNREINEVEDIDLYESYHTHDYFGFVLEEAFEESDFIGSKKEESGPVLVLAKK